MGKSLVTATLLVIAGCVSMQPRAAAQSLPPEARLVMSHFKANGGGGDERLYISWSADGLNWTDIRNDGLPVWQPPGWAGFTNVVRDPTITFRDGYYWVAYTSGNYGKGTTFGLIKSADLLNWTQVALVDAALPGAPDQLTWSPTFFEDGDGSFHIIVAISPTGGTTYSPVPDLRVHEMHPVNADWTQWSTPVPLALPNPNNNDCWVWKEGLTYHAVYADFARGGGVVHATSANLVTGWIERHYLGYPSQEGNVLLVKPDGGYRLYVEQGNSGSLGYRTADYTADFTNPTPQTPVNATVPMQNGKVCAVRGVKSYAQWRDQNLAAVVASDREPMADPDADGLFNLTEHTLATHPLAFTPPVRRPQLFNRQLGDARHPGLIFDFLRSSSDVTVEVQARIGSTPWSSDPAEVTIESLTLMSDGTTRVQARSTAPQTSEPTLLRISSSLSVPEIPALAPAKSTSRKSTSAKRRR